MDLLPGFESGFALSILFNTPLTGTLRKAEIDELPPCTRQGGIKRKTPCSLCETSVARRIVQARRTPSRIESQPVVFIIFILRVLRVPAFDLIRVRALPALNVTLTGARRLRACPC